MASSRSDVELRLVSSVAAPRCAYLATCAAFEEGRANLKSTLGVEEGGEGAPVRVLSAKLLPPQVTSSAQRRAPWSVQIEMNVPVSLALVDIKEMQRGIHARCFQKTT